MGYRLLTGFLGVCFLGIGLVFTVAIPSMASDGDVIALVALPVALLFAVFGIIHLAFFSYNTLFDEKGIHLYFVFTEECVPWENVASYKNVGFKNRFTGGAYVWVLLTCRVKINVLTDRALLFLPGEGPVLGMSAKDYTTELNKRIPAQAR